MYLKDSFQKGFLAGPKETEEEFQSRIEKNEELQKEPKFPGLPKGEYSVIPPSLICLRSSKKLPFWFGGMTWICEVDKISIPVLQLPKRMRLSWLKEEEIIAHERVHALRTLFQEPKFEEIVAYRTSSSAFRRYLGPIFQNDRESFLFFIFAIVGLYTLYPLIGFFTLLLIRLMNRQRIFSKALKRLSEQYQDPERTIACLTDREILLYAKKRESLIDTNSLRWQQIRQVFHAKVSQ